MTLLSLTSRVFLMELHEDLKAARTHDLDHDLDEKIARIRMGLSVLYLGIAFVMTLIAIWILNLEGTTL